MAEIDTDAKIRMVNFPKTKPWWQQFMKKKTDDQVVIESALREFETLMRTGTVQLPGEVWMPSLHIE